MQRHFLWAAFCFLALPVFASEDESAEDAHVSELEKLDQETLDKAETLFFEGLANYRAERWKEAAAQFKSAYALAPHRDLLFNVARCAERQNHNQEAVRYYRAYLATQPADETGVIHRIQLLGGDPTPLALDAKDPKAQPQAQKNTAKADSGDSSSSSSFPWVYVLGGTGAAALAVGTILGINALGEADDARTVVQRERAKSHKSNAESFALGADITLGIGVVTAGLAGWLWWRSRNAQQAETQGHLGVALDGETTYLGYSGTF